MQLIWCFVLLCWASTLSAQIRVTIMLTEPAGEPAPFVPFELAGKKRPVSLITDWDGKAEALLPPNYRFQIQTSDPRYKRIITKARTGSGDTLLKFTLEPKPNQDQLKGNINWDDPADYIISEAIKRRVWNHRRQDHMSMLALSSVRVYVDTVRSNFPRFWLFSQIPDSQWQGTAYISQAISQLQFREQSSTVHEHVLQFREAGDPEMWPFSRDARRFHQFSLYQSEATPLAFSDEMFISPVAWGAFQYYRYKRTETYYLSGIRMHRIAVEPRNRFGPVWAGEIVLAEGSWALQEARLRIRVPAPVYLVDSVEYFMQCRLIGNDRWYPVSGSMKAWKRIYGTDIRYEIQTAYFDHNADNPSGQFPLLMQYNLPPSVVEMDDKNWNSPIFETDSGEQALVRKKIQLIQWQSGQTDSASPLPQFRPKIGIHQIMMGFNAENPVKRTQWEVDGIINDKMEFNTVEGFTLKHAFVFRKQFASGWLMEWIPMLRYGFQDKELKGKSLLKFSHPRHFRTMELEGGRWLFQINQSDPIHPIINSIYTLLLRKNYMKLYRSDFVRFRYSEEMLNGLYISGGLEWASRSTLENTTDFSLIPYPGQDFTPNNPNAATDPDYVLTNHRRLHISAGITYKPFQRYGVYLQEKRIYPSSMPVISLFYKGAVPLLGGDARFGLVEFSIAQDIPLRLFGTGSYTFKAGQYLSTKNMTYLDFTHFLGEQTYFLGSSANATYLDQFRALDYYQYSTNRPYIELHYQHNFRGFLLSQIPGIRKLRWNHYVGLNTLVIFDGNPSNYTEVYYGVDNVLGAIKALNWFNLRFDVAMRVRETGFYAPSLLVGLGTRFYNRR